MSAPKQKFGWLLLALALLPPSVHAHSTALLLPPPPSPAMQYVRDLLVLDAAAALNAEAVKVEMGSPRHLAAHPPGYFLSTEFASSSLSDDKQAQSTPQPQRDVRLKAIVGVGQRLSAMLEIDGQTMVYRTGRDKPISGIDNGVRLIKISAPCVELRRKNGQSDTHCIRADGNHPAEVKP